MMRRRTAVRFGLILTSLAAISPSAMALSYGTQSVSNGDQTAYAYGNAYVSFTSAWNVAYVKVKILNGKGGYSAAEYWSAQNSAYTRSGDSQNTSYKDVRMRTYISAPTAGPWSARAKTCINVPWKADPCSGWSNSGAA